MLTAIVEQAQELGFNFGFLVDPYESGPLLRGILTTIELTLLCGAVSLFTGVIVAACLTSRRHWLRLPARAFVEVTRNTPTLVQLYCAFLVLNMLITEALKEAGGNPLNAFVWVVIVIGLHAGAYHAEALRAGLEAVPSTMIESARSLALSRQDILLWIELPVATRFALPSIINNLVEMTKMTVIASAVAVNEITYESIMIWTQRDNVLELMSVILLFFWALTFVIGQAGRLLEERLRMPGYGH